MLKQSLRNMLGLAAVLALVGAGCASQSPDVIELPTVPPTPSAVETSSADEDIVTPSAGVEEGGAMMEKDSTVMEKKDEVADSIVMEKKDETVMEKSEPESETTVMEREEPVAEPEAEEKKEVAADLSPYYIAYTEEGLARAQAEGRPVMLYFWASWCPICRKEEPDIIKWVESSEHPVAGFRVNFDTEKVLKSKLGVPFQHTTVFLNAKGEEVERFTGPSSEAQFRAAFDKSAN